MKEVHIAVAISGYNRKEYIALATISLPETDLEDCGPINYPAPGTDPATAELFCTPVKVREVVERNRERFAARLTRQILECLGANDTVMGYEMRIAK